MAESTPKEEERSSLFLREEAQFSLAAKMGMGGWEKRYQTPPQSRIEAAIAEAENEKEVGLPQERRVLALFGIELPEEEADNIKKLFPKEDEALLSPQERLARSIAVCSHLNEHKFLLGLEGVDSFLQVDNLPWGTGKKSVTRDRRENIIDSVCFLLTHFEATAAAYAFDWGKSLPDFIENPPKYSNILREVAQNGPTEGFPVHLPCTTLPEKEKVGGLTYALIKELNVPPEVTRVQKINALLAVIQMSMDILHKKEEQLPKEPEERRPEEPKKEKRPERRNLHSFFRRLRSSLRT